MAETAQTKQQLKEIIYEVINEDKEYFKGIIHEVIKDYAMGKAIEEGEQADYVPESTIMDILKD